VAANFSISFRPKVDSAPVRDVNSLRLASEVKALESSNVSYPVQITELVEQYRQRSAVIASLKKVLDEEVEGRFCIWIGGSASNALHASLHHAIEKFVVDHFS
jgi:hypothetical protein